MITDKSFTVPEFVEKSKLLIAEFSEKMKARNELVTIQVEQTGPLQYDIIAQEPGLSYGVTIARLKDGRVSTTRFYGV